MRLEKFLIGLLGLIIMSFVALENGLNYPDYWPKPVYNFHKNPLDSNKILLGRMLFYDPVLSADSTISCASCHSSYNAFAHVDHDLSHGINDRIGIRNAPALMNLAWQPVFMMDGAVNHLDVQALAPIANPDEMGSSIQQVVLKLKRSSFYPALFNVAFGSKEISGERVLKSIAQFMLTIQSHDAKYDRVMSREESFTIQEAKGFELFKQNCASCHQPPLFTNFSFKNNGLPLNPKLNDTGRERITGKSEDLLFFKVPTLRNIAYSFPYMHDGRFKNLSAVVNFYANLTDKERAHTSLEKPISLSADERVDLISFLLTLNDKKFVFNPDYSYPKKIFDSVRRVNP